MSSFRKIGGIRSKSNEPKLQKQVESKKEMHISQVESEVITYYPLMSDNESACYFEDSALTYGFNQIIKDYTLNTDNLSVTTIFNVESLTFTDGSVISSALKEPFNQYYELGGYDDDAPICLRFSDVGIYLITFLISLDKKKNNNELNIYFGENMTNPNLTFVFHNTLVLTGTFTVNYSKFCESIKPNQTVSSKIIFKISSITENSELSYIINGSNITTTRIA